MKFLPHRKKYGNIFDIDEDLWKYIYTLPILCTKKIKMQNFKYKINMRCLMTKSRLYDMNITEDNLCILCKTHVETMKHPFIDCDIGLGIAHQNFKCIGF